MAKSSTDYENELLEAVKTLRLVELKYHSTMQTLFLEITTPKYSNILVKTSRLHDLLTHGMSFSMMYSFNNVPAGTIEDLKDGETHKKGMLNHLMINSNEVFSYCYKHFPDKKVVKEWKKIHEPEEKIKTIVK